MILTLNLVIFFIRQDLSTCVWRSITQVRQGRSGSPMLLRGRQNRSFLAAHALRPITELRLQLLRRILRTRPADGGRRMSRCDCAMSRGRNVASVSRQKYGTRHRWLRTRLLLLYVRAYLYRRWHCHGLQGQSTQPGS